MALSPETKRSVWIVVFAGLAIALIGGTLALPKALFPQQFGSSQSQSATSPSANVAQTQTPEGPVPDKVRTWFEDDLGLLPLPYPGGKGTPEVEQVLPQVQGSTYVTADNTSITIEVPSRYLDPDGEEAAQTYAVYRRGDLSVLEALWWRCDWVEELVSAEKLKDEPAIETARASLEAFPDFDVLKGTSVAKTHAAELDTVLSGDVAAGEAWLKNSCGR